MASDYYSKVWAENHLKNQPALTLIHDFVDLGFSENRGMVFGILNNQMNSNSQQLFVVFRILILIALSIFVWSRRRRTTLHLLALALIWVGATGNLIDHFRYGYVVDFIHLQAGQLLNWPFYFNVADAYVTAGIILFLAKGLAQTHTNKRLSDSSKKNPGMAVL